MLRSNDLVQAYIQLIRRASRATSASLYLPVPSVSSIQTVLVHDGEAAPVPELADLAAAEQFCRGLKAAVLPGSAVAIRQFSSRLEGGVLLGIPAVDSVMLHQLLASAPAGQGRRANRRASDRAPAGREAAGAWLGLRFEDPAPSQALLAKALDFITDPDPDEGRRPKEWWTWLLTIGGALAWHTRWVADLLNDPISGLPGRAELQALVNQALRRAGDGHGAAGLIVVNPDDFGVINERFGLDAGDEVVREVAERLRTTLRTSDAVCRYGGAVFAVIVHSASHADVAAVATKLQETLTGSAYWRGKVRLSFSIGLATSDPPLPSDVDEATTTLIRRADNALNAAKLGGGQIVVWRSDEELKKMGPLDRLTGVFTASLTKDYRNMLLLWDTISIVAARADSEDLVTQVVARIAHTFRPAQAELFLPGDDGWTRWNHRGAPEKTPLSDGPLVALLDESRSEGRPRKRLLVRSDENGAGEVTGCAVPLIASDQCLGCLYLEGPVDLRLDGSDLVFLEALARQLAVALDRARLAEMERGRQEQERRRLRSELQDLRQALQQAKLVYRSSQMQAVVATARRAAATDATVLIRGESGTGKELLARTIHELSPRRKKPLVVVDCSAISTSLIDSELFGHVRGAFTGAAERASGRLAEADGGTVMLDEIGELPLEVQGKLLRFVQEKQLFPVGGNRPLRVDARVLAVTNRDLVAEVEAGRFRHDLYHRLNVVHLVVPPLRERPDDIGLLARTFVEQLSVQYQKAIEGLTPEAEARLLEHSWPGNVRELQNRILRAAIFCEGERIGLADLGFDEPAAKPGGGERAANAADAVMPETAETFDTTGSAGGAWTVLAAALGRRIDGVLAGSASPPPFGRWLQEDLVLEAHRAAEGAGRRAAALLGVPESTFRRRLGKARREVNSGFSRRPDDWQTLRPKIVDLVAVLAEADNGTGEDALERARKALLCEVLGRLPANPATGAALMGVTVPTFHRWTEAVRPGDAGGHE
jgi:diguanylate cyclase (GGDEF)-like protein